MNDCAPYIPCPGCTQLLYAGEECRICLAIARMRRTWLARKGRRVYLEMTSPSEKDLTETQ